MKRYKKTIISLSVILLLAGLVSFAFYLRSVMDYKQAVKETTFHEIDISKVPDGNYMGEYDVDFIYAKVEVSVQNGKITDIVILEHKNQRGKHAEAIINDMINKQDIDVDTISGATNSSVVIKKAVETALKGRK